MTHSRFFRMLRTTLCLFLCVAILVFGCFWKPLVAEAIPIAIPIVAAAAVAGLIMVSGVMITNEVDLKTAAEMVWGTLTQPIRDNLNLALGVVGAGAVTYNYIKGYNEAVVPAETVGAVHDAIVSTFGAESVPGFTYTKENVYIPVGQIASDADAFSSSFAVFSVVNGSSISFPTFNLGFDSDGGWVRVRIYLQDGSYIQTFKDRLLFADGSRDSQLSVSGRMRAGYPEFYVLGRYFDISQQKWVYQNFMWDSVFNWMHLRYFNASGVDMGNIVINTGRATVSSTGAVIFPQITGASSPLNWLYKLVGSTTFPYNINPTKAWPHPPISIPAEGDVAIPVPQSIPDAITLAPDLTIDTPANPEPGGPFDPNKPPDLPKLSLPAMIFTKKFPFSLPYDLYMAFANLVVPAEPPVFEVRLPFKKLGLKDEVLTVDFVRYNKLAIITRWGLSVAFVIGLIIITRKMIGAE